MAEKEKNAAVELLKAENQLKAGASWFYWIAGLSLVNSVIALWGDESRGGFVIGLGITQFIDGLGLLVAEKAEVLGKVVAIALDVIVAGLFVLFGVFARKQYKWAFIVGMVLYGLDALLFLLVSDFLSIGFHVFALFFIYAGYKAMSKLSMLEAAGPGSQVMPGGVPGAPPAK